MPNANSLMPPAVVFHDLNMQHFILHLHDGYPNFTHLKRGKRLLEHNEFTIASLGSGQPLSNYQFIGEKKELNNLWVHVVIGIIGCRTQILSFS